jgi:four helix bundle protein
MKILRFEELEIWKIAIGVVKEIYNITSIGKFSKDFGLRDQIRRAAVSISSNIVEGFEKRSNNEFRRFLLISKGSAAEVRNQLFIALAIGYITQKEFDKTDKILIELGGKIGSFVNYLEKTKK